MSITTPILKSRSRIAVIGAGISGLGAAWALRHVHDVTVFEKRERLGGHANTVTIDYDGTNIDVDTGFIVFNQLNYPNLTALFEHLEMLLKFFLGGKCSSVDTCKHRILFVSTPIRSS